MRGQRAKGPPKGDRRHDEEVRSAARHPLYGGGTDAVPADATGGMKDQEAAIEPGEFGREITAGRERVVTPNAISIEEEVFNQSLRPTVLSEYVGQRTLVEKLEIAIEAARRRDEPIEHILFHGPPGLGKTTLAYIIAHSMGASIVTTSGPALERTHQMVGILTNLRVKDVLFIDEIHRLPVNIEEFLYPAMEDFRMDIPLDKGPYARVTSYRLKKFTLIGATTRAGTVSAPLRNRFGLSFHLDFYAEDDLQEIILRSAHLLEARIGRSGAGEIARRARGTPRIANRLLRRVRDYADVKADGKITPEVAKQAMKLEGIDNIGLDGLDRKFLSVIIRQYGGGPVGVEALAATLNEEVDTLVDVVEPYLLQLGFISRTRSGRMANEPAYRHLNLKHLGETQARLPMEGPSETD